MDLTERLTASFKIILLSAFLMVAALGLMTSVSSATVTLKTPLCPAGASQCRGIAHVNHWQQAFIAPFEDTTSVKNILVYASLELFALTAAVLAGFLDLQSIVLAIRATYSRLKIADYLQQSLSQGTLQPNL